MGRIRPVVEIPVVKEVRAHEALHFVVPAKIASALWRWEQKGYMYASKYVKLNSLQFHTVHYMITYISKPALFTHTQAYVVYISII